MTIRKCFMIMLAAIYMFHAVSVAASPINCFFDYLSKVTTTVHQMVVQHKYVATLGLASCAAALVLHKPIVNSIRSLVQTIKNNVFKNVYQKPHDCAMSYKSSQQSLKLPALTHENITNMLKETIKILPKIDHCLQAQIVPGDAQILVIGDIHGEINILQRTIERMRQEGFFEQSDPWRLKNNTILMFTGDLADRGTNGIEVWQMAMQLMQHNPDKVFITRGNHEEENIAARYGFFSPEIPRKFQGFDLSIIKLFNELFERLPLAVFLGIKPAGRSQIRFGMFCHGSPEERAIKDIQDVLAEAKKHEGELCDTRITLNISSQSLNYNGFLWGDCDNTDYGTIGYGNEGARGVLGVFCYNVLGVSQFLKCISNDECIVDYMAGGHNHNPYAVVQLNEPNKSPIWIPLTKACCVKPGNVFKFMSLDGEFGQQVKSQFKNKGTEGFGVFRMNESTQEWQLIPHIY